MNHASETPLSEAGHDLFGTVQEVITYLNANPTTDWRTVNLDALRQHLLDMRDMSINTQVISQRPIPHGVQITTAPTTKRAEQALTRVFAAHPSQLKKESGWDMTVARKDGNFVLTTVSKNTDDVYKIRGLGYIGLMDYGKHHQAHHLSIATGKEPHHEHAH